MAAPQEFTEIPNNDTHNCFACSPKNTMGLRMKFESDGELVRSRIKIPDHLCGYSKVVHGGIVATILDEVMGWAGIHLLKKITMTKTMTVDYIKAVPMDDTLLCEGRIVEVTGKREALLEGAVYSEDGELCAKAEGSFFLLTAKLAIRLGVMDEEEITGFYDPLFGIKL